jgi:NAD(P)-dependent dehydrogenase (short-subunit alcohol dehydrogenase family)
MPSGTVLVTGASTGIGEATVHHLKTLGFDSIGAVRKDEDAERLEARGVRTVRIDVTDAGQIAAARDELGDIALEGLVNNAGIAVAAPLEFLPMEKLRQQLEINLIGQAAVTQAFLPALRRARGRIVNVSSIGGRVALPLLGAYNASKFGFGGHERLAAARAAPAGRRRDPDRAGWREDADLGKGQGARRRHARGRAAGGRAALRPHGREGASRNGEDRAGARDGAE